MISALQAFTLQAKREQVVHTWISKTEMKFKMGNYANNVQTYKFHIEPMCKLGIKMMYYCMILN